MIKKVRFVRPALFAALLCGVSAATALAQDPASSPAPGSPPPLTTPPPGHHGPPMPLFDALDTNHDGVLSAEEIANATASLKTLLKNGSDHLTRDDLRPVGAPGGPAEDRDADQPRPKIGAIRPHGPPHQEADENAEGPMQPPHRMHPPGPGHEQSGEDEDRPRPRPEWRRDDRRPDQEAREEDRAEFRHERMGRHHGPADMEDADRADDDARPPRPEGRREDRQARPPRGPRPDDARPPRPHGPAGDETDARPMHHGPMPSPLFDALDTNHDGNLSADEIANAPASLKALLKNGSDHLTRDDLRPAGGPPAHPADR